MPRKKKKEEEVEEEVPEIESDSTASEEGPEEAEARRQAAYQKKLIQTHLEKEVKTVSIWVPESPAPPQSPQRSKKSIPANLLTISRLSGFERAANSTLGRFVVFAATLIFFGLVNILLVSWNSPDNWLNGQAMILAVMLMISCLTLYTVVPYVSSFAGLTPSKEGVDWKPYLVMYRIAFFFTVPALFMMNLGPSTRVAFGEQFGEKGVPLEQVPIGSYKYFEASDGFVALNLTKGILETLERTLHDKAVPRMSRYKNAEVRVNREPYSDEVDPTIPPGVQAFYMFAPVFRHWGSCQTRYRISTACLKSNVVVGWAMARTQSLCTNLRMVGCTIEQPPLRPRYRCGSTNPVSGEQATAEIEGLCGRSVLMPKTEIVDELRALLILDGWPENSLPNTTQGWYDVTPDPCISFPQDCISRWGMYEMIGLAFIGLTVFCTFITASIDCFIDARIREAVQFAQSVAKATGKPGATSASGSLF
eukprot:TRINITY_DN10507_c0_g4_i1.p1 TRINITY_DN10507_c0_g4~~TRINITY_DN10507_c0_g4_i1.p1  ORF type:complete len:478 (+),score=55.04 TRINITY_DN10507_c0_g4_i1:85-1518(+)